MNLLKGKLQCIECKSKKLIKDHHRKEIYCSKCGLILVNTDIPTINHYENQTKPDHENKQNKKLEKIQYHRIEKYLYNFF